MARAIIVPATELPSGAVARRWLDFDGDGLDDEVTHLQSPRSIRVRYRNTSLAETTFAGRDAECHPREDDCRNYRPELCDASVNLDLAGAGDVNGDGFMDALVTEDRGTDRCISPFYSGTRSFYLAFGGPDGLGSALQFVAIVGKPDLRDWQNGTRLEAGDDLNDDGYEELLEDRRLWDIAECHGYDNDRGYLSAVAYLGGPHGCAHFEVQIPRSAGLDLTPDLDGDALPEVCGYAYVGVDCFAIRGHEAVRWTLPSSCNGVALRFSGRCRSRDSLIGYSVYPQGYRAIDANRDGLMDIVSDVLLPDDSPTEVTFFGGSGGLSASRCQFRPPS